jgi:Tetratricopeptide repeat
LTIALRLIAFYAPETIPLKALLQRHPGFAEQVTGEVAAMLLPLLEDPLAASDAIVALRRYPLVSLSDDESVSAHLLVQAVTTDQMPTELAAQWQHAAAALIEAAIPEDSEQPETWPVFASLLPHAEAVLDASSEGMLRIAEYLGDSGNYAAACDLMREAVVEFEREFGPQDLRGLAVRSGLAQRIGEAGDPVGARDQYAALLPDLEQLFGPEDPTVLAVRANLAMATGEAGDAVGARDGYAALVSDFERSLGPEHPNTLSARANRAMWTAQAGDPQRAREQLSELLPVVERVRGPEHPNTLTTRGNLAQATGEAGDAAGARDQYAALLSVIERVLGPEHPRTLDVRSNLGDWTSATGDATGPATSTQHCYPS